MTITVLAAAYVAIGLAAATAALVARKGAVDAALLLGLWPLHGPLLVLGGDPRERELLAALRRAAATPLGALLPDAASARALARRLRDAAARVRELDALLARPDFDEAAARARVDELERRGATACAVATAGLRAQTLERLRALRDRCRAELVEVDELIAQLVAQAELLRLSGAADGAAADLVRELVARVEGLDGLLAE